MPGYAYLMVGAAMLAAVVLMILTGRRERARAGTYNAEALSFVGGVFNALFIVMIAFYTVITWTEADAAGQQARAEASGLIEIYWLIAGLPEPDRAHIRALIREYTEEVAVREWAALDRGESSRKAGDLMVTLRAELARIPGTTEELADARDRAEQIAREVADQRRARIAAAAEDRLLLRMLLIGAAVGAIAVFGYPLLIGFSADARHVSSLAVLAAILAFVMYFSVELDHPYRGLIRIEPDAFRTALAEYQRIP